MTSFKEFILCPILDRHGLSISQLPPEAPVTVRNLKGTMGQDNIGQRLAAPGGCGRAVGLCYPPRDSSTVTASHDIV